MSRDKIQPLAVLSDFDNTLYKHNDDIQHYICVAAAHAALACGVDLTLDEATDVAHRSVKDHHYAGMEFVLSHGVPAKRMHYAIGWHLKHPFLIPCEKTRTLFNCLAGRCAVLTQSATHSARHGILNLNLKDIFAHHMIFGFEHTGFELRSESPRAFKLGIAALRVPFELAMKIDDLQKNLIYPHRLGAQTVWLHHGKPVAELPEHVDYQYRDIVEALTDIAGWPKVWSSLRPPATRSEVARIVWSLRKNPGAYSSAFSCTPHSLEIM